LVFVGDSGTILTLRYGWTDHRGLVIGIKSMKDLGRNIFLVTLTEDPGPSKMEELRGQNAHVTAVQPNFVYRIIGSGNAQ